MTPIQLPTQLTNAVLSEAAALIADSVNWTKKTLARDAEGNRVDPCDPHAACWCTMGAIERVLGGDKKTLAIVEYGLEQRLHARSGLDPEIFTVANFNDDATTSHADVMELLRAG